MDEREKFFLFSQGRKYQCQDSKGVGEKENTLVRVSSILLERIKAILRSFY
jgi:hypothetical protein